MRKPDGSEVTGKENKFKVAEIFYQEIITPETAKKFSQAKYHECWIWNKHRRYKYLQHRGIAKTARHQKEIELYANNSKTKVKEFLKFS